MKMNVLWLVMASGLVLVGCNERNTVIFDDFGADARRPGDIIEEPPWPEVCNPVTQAGCASGEKCGQLLLVADDMETPNTNEFLARIACVPDGACH